MTVLKTGCVSAIESASVNTEGSSENQSAATMGSSHMVAIDSVTGTAKVMITPGAGTNAVGPDSSVDWKYKKGDIIEYQNGKAAFTVRKSLGCGSFGEVHQVWNEMQQKLRAMKCTKFGNMTPSQRITLFKPMCEEALIMMELRHHPNIISLRFVKVSGSEFLLIMDLVDGSKELSEAYQDGTIWTPLRQQPPSASHATSLLALLWYQLANAMSHLHSKQIMVCAFFAVYL